MHSLQGIFIVLFLSAISLISACGNCSSDVCDDIRRGRDCQTMWYTGDNCDVFINQRAYKSNSSTANALNSTSIDVEWKSKDDLPDSLWCYYGYAVKYWMNESNDKTTSNDVPHQANQNHHSITISGLQPATTYVFQVFMYRKLNNKREEGAGGSNEVTATTLGSETTSAPTAQVTTETPTTTITTPTTTTTATTSTATFLSTTATTSTPTTTTTTPTKTTTISSTTTSSPSPSTTAPPVTSSPTTSASSSAPRTATTASNSPDSQDPDNQNNQQKTIVALGVIIVLLVIVILVSLLVHFLQRRRINQLSKTVITSTTEDLSYGTDYENVAMSSSPDALTASNQVRSAGRADLTVPSQDDAIITSINDADHSGTEQPYETLENYQEVKGEYSRLNTTPTD